MQEELPQLEIQKVWILVDLPFRKKAIGTKWVYRNKKDERGVVVRNKARLVTQGHRQEEGIYYDEVFAPMARIEAIRIFLAFSSYMGFIVYQMDVKSAFLYGKIDEEVYVSQPPGFLDPKYPQKVYKVVKALYGLHQAPRAWYATLSTFLLKNGYIISQDKYVAEILKKSMIGSLMYVTASRPDIMFAVCACSRFQVTPIVADSIPEPTGENLGDHSSNDASLSGNEDDMTLQNVYDLCISLCQQVSDQAKEIKLLKAKITKLKKKANHVIKHFKAYQKRISKEQRQQRKSLSKKKKVQIESVSKQGRKNAKGDGKEKLSTDRPKLSTDDLKVSTDKQMESTDDQVDAAEEKVKSTAEQKESTEEQTKEEIATQASQTPSSIIFGDDEIIATLLINMSKAKTASKEKEKGIELKDVEDTDRLVVSNQI
ncbi:putative ribonuclease H-like domain-containing protein [Tanacetum coccineum]